MSIMLYTVADLYQHLDNLFDQHLDADTLFASGYLRGVISLCATPFGDEQQLISTPLINSVSAKLVQTKTELSPQDNVIIQNFWLSLQQLIRIKSFV